MVRFATDNVLMLRPSEAVDGGFGTRRAQLDASFRELGLDFIVVQAMQRFPCREEFLHGGERSRRRRLLWNRALGAVVVGDKWQMQFLRCIGGTPQAQRCRAVFRWRCGTTTQKLRTAGVKGRRAGGSAACFAGGLYQDANAVVGSVKMIGWLFSSTFMEEAPHGRVRQGRIDGWTQPQPWSNAVVQTDVLPDATLASEDRVDHMAAYVDLVVERSRPQGGQRQTKAMVQQEASARRNIAGEISARVK